MRYCVLGAGGFIGSNLCRTLVRQGFSVSAFGRQKTFPDALEGSDWISGDFSDSMSIKNAISGCDIVFHLVTGTTPADANINKLTDLNTNVVNTLQLLDVCRQTGIRRIVFVSSGGTVYGIPNQVPIQESAATNPITAYGISKLAIEKYLSLYEYLYGLEYRVLRVANPFGPYQMATKNQGVIAAFMHRALIGNPIEVWGDGSVIRDYVFVDDVIEALILAASHEGSGRIFNIGSGEGRSLNDVIGAIKKLVGKNIMVNYRPGRLVDIPISILDTRFAQTELDWQVRTPFNEGMCIALKWMRERTANIVI